MAQTEAQKRAVRKYQAEHCATLSCKLRKEDAEAFKAACKAAGTTPNAVFRDASSRFMATAPQSRGTE